MDKLSIDYSFLSDDLVFKEILPKLPAKSLMRFKAVSKSWLARISTDSTFTADHLRLHYPNAAEFSSIIRARFSDEEQAIPRLFFLGRDTSRLVEIDTSYMTRTSSPSEVTCFIRIIGSANGLVLLRQYYSNGSSALALWNPVTGEFNRLPAPTLPSIPGVSLCWQCRLEEYYLGFDKDSNDYKIVRLEDFVSKEEDDDDDDIDSVVERTVIDVQLFTKSSGSWRKLKGLRGSELSPPRLKSVVDGAMHWAIIRGDTPAKSSVFRVLSFDVHSEEFREWDGPVLPDDDDDEYVYLDLIEWKGSLGALMIKPDFKECQFWLNTKNNNGSECDGKNKNMWTKMSIVEPNIPSWSFGCVFRDQLIVLDPDKQKEFSYDFVSKEVIELEDDLGRVYFYEVFNYKPNSLVSPYY